MMAVLEKRLGLHLGQCDAYVNIAGGMKIVEPAVDLALAMAIVSSFLNIPVDDSLIAVGEIGLSGEVRSVSQIEQRVSEAAKMGYGTCVIPEAGADRLKGIKGLENIRIVPVDSVKKAISIIQK